MSEETQEAPSETQESSQSGSSEQGEQTTQAESLSLDDLYGEFKPQETPPPQSTQQQHSRQETHDPSGYPSQGSYDNIPDPVNDPEGFKRWNANVAKDIAAVRAEAQTVQQKLQEKEQELSAQAEERDFRNVAEEIAKSAEVDPELVEAGLLHKYVKDKAFQQMWQNRQSNPKAFSKVKSVLSNEMKNRFTTRVDPQIAENQRAAEEADKGSQGKKKEEQSLEEKLMKSSVRDFDRELARLRGNTSL